MVRRLSIIFFLFIALCASCLSCVPEFSQLKHPLNSANLHKTVYVSNRFTFEEKQSIVAALAEWRCATGGMADFKVVLNQTDDQLALVHDNLDNTLIVIPVSITHPAIFAEDMKRNDNLITTGLWLDRRIWGEVPEILLVTERVKDEELNKLFLHELGHALLGSGHLKEECIMNGDMSQSSNHITVLDMKYFCSKYECSAATKLMLKNNDKVQVCN